MSNQPQYDSYRYTGEICRLQSQSMVECRLPGSEIGSILAVQATATPTECACMDGEVRYGGKLLLCVLYEDAGGKVCRVERGAEFFHKADGEKVNPACFAKVAFNVDKVTHRREGSGLYLSAVISATSNVYGGLQIEHLIGGENLALDVKEIAVCKTVCVSGETEGEDEFDADYVGDILLHGERALVTRVNAGAGQLDIEGEIALNVCVLKGENDVCSYERILPFSMQIPCEEAFGQVKACARAIVKDVQLTAGVDEEKGKSKIVFSYGIGVDCFLFAQETLSVAQDAFSTTRESNCHVRKDGGRYLINTLKFTERVSGIAALSQDFGGEYALEAAVLPRAELVCKKTENGVEAEGVVAAEVLLRAPDGGRKSCALALPVLFPLDVKGEIVEADCVVCGLTMRRKKDGETETEATLKISLRVYEERTWTYVDEIVEGEAYAKNDAALSVFVPREGENLWQVAKRLRCGVEELQKSNPNLQFPVKAGERIFVYRQIK